MTVAVKVREEDIIEIIKWGATLNRDLGYIRDTFEVCAEEGEDLWVIASPNQFSKCQTIAEVEGCDFVKNWKLIDGETPGHFNEIERI